MQNPPSKLCWDLLIFITLLSELWERKIIIIINESLQSGDFNPMLFLELEGILINLVFWAHGPAFLVYDNSLFFSSLGNFLSLWLNCIHMNHLLCCYNDLLHQLALDAKGGLQIFLRKQFSLFLFFLEQKIILLLTKHVC